MHYPPQLIKLSKTKNGSLWINPEQIIFAEQYEKKSDEPKPEVKDPKTAKAAQPVFETVLHMAGKEPKLFVKESPEEINAILRNLKRRIVTETAYSYK